MKYSQFQLIGPLSLMISLMFSMTGCGNLLYSQSNQAPTNAFYYTQNQSSSTSSDSGINTSNYICTGETSIYPQGQSTSTSSESFSVCTSITNGDRSNIMVQGETAGSNTICVFPAKETGSGSKSFFTDPNNSKAPLYQCAAVSDGLSVYNFQSLGSTSGFNAMYVVAQADATAMQACLLAQMAGCPYYFYGKFRTN